MASNKLYINMTLNVYNGHPPKVIIDKIVQASSTKSLISDTYHALLERFLLKFPLVCRAHWEKDIGPIPYFTLSSTSLSLPLS